MKEVNSIQYSRSYERRASKGRNYETELPKGYSLVMTVDANNKKTIAILNIITLLVSAIGAFICCMIYGSGLFTLGFGIMILGTYITYIVLHELTHGAAYKIMTGRKLTFGMSPAAAFCGVPDIYVNRKTALTSVLAPFTVYNVVFLLGAVLISNPAVSFCSAIMLALHIGGCSGDLYDAFLLFTKLNDPSILMNDDGLKQTFYKKMN